jgi:X-X-X-Leu-X-X-Gly heptad repeat protein
MKNISLLIFAFLLSFGAMAQVTDSTMNNNNSTMNNSNTKVNGDETKAVSEFYAFKDGKLVKVKNKVKTEQKDNVTLSDGTQILSNGTVQYSDGTTATLKEGEWIDDKGKIHEGRMNKMHMDKKDWNNDNKKSWNKSDSSMNHNENMNMNSRDTIK